MSWTITPTQLLVDDQDALTYLAAVEAADGQALESGVRLAVNAFVKGCKADGIWPAINASCILAGARTLTGALVPLAGAAPTSVDFVGSDYNRKTGLKGGDSKRLTTPSVLPNNVESRHAYLYCSEASTGNDFNCVMGTSGDGSGEIIKNNSPSSFLLRGWIGQAISSLTNGVGGLGVARTVGSSRTFTTTAGLSSGTTGFNNGSSLAVTFFARSAAGFQASNPRIPFVSAGRFLDLSQLDARVTDLINALSAAIP